MIEFAETLRKSGKDVFDSILLASRQRLRPILMTTLAFGFGILPLATASGAGAAAQKSIGTGMLGGIIFSATFGIILVPVLYIAVLKIVGKLPRET
ncbi:efflux RND transporter permease subunit, partial [Falsirhodobacter sp. alg1]|uniref:efflux RND transporter permease subunit n=1 Tax=Falsirhodobacter sp. alg1 TaxID=1472418 RepID=UPI00128EB1A0